MPRIDRDLTDLGLTDPDRFPVRRVRGPRPVPPHPRPPLDDDPPRPPAARPDAHIRRIDRLMGWDRDDRRQAWCATCTQGPGQPCVTATGKRMTGVHPDRGETTGTERTR